MINLRLYTPRLILRKPVWEDTLLIHKLHSLPETDLYNTLGIPQQLDDTQKIVQEWIAAYQESSISHFTFVIESQDTYAFIGLIAIQLGPPKYKIGEVWYKLHPDHWRKGFATEALQTILNFGFRELKLHRIEAGCAVDNLASARVLEKAGMQREGRKRKVLPLKSGWSDNYTYAILEEDVV
ncbi:GNAT family N-acetyltransferase [Catalinimonas niigatensis]|uniref:GNAT family N-acetyltransferase n=1 Tax=Catalinimonas niigatensis TaxID=1397264 RepID=UPI002665231C|nr:GNAT family N-acetyltransferase [Catalinimonas niigatensis]WPP51581.1 GNAT family N-acetyltransferase [Catalinimonas niigatensis]